MLQTKSFTSINVPVMPDVILKSQYCMKCHMERPIKAIKVMPVH